MTWEMFFYVGTAIGFVGFLFLGCFLAFHYMLRFFGGKR